MKLTIMHSTLTYVVLMLVASHTSALQSFPKTRQTSIRMFYELCRYFPILIELNLIKESFEVYFRDFYFILFLMSQSLSRISPQFQKLRVFFVFLKLLGVNHKFFSKRRLHECEMRLLRLWWCAYMFILILDSIRRTCWFQIPFEEKTI